MNTDKAVLDRLAEQVVRCVLTVSNTLGIGFLEKVYENALAHRLSKAGLMVKQQHPINVFDEDGTLIGEYLADLLIEDSLIVELKTAKALAPEHEAQVLGYLKSSRLEDDLLINFGSYRFQIRKYVLSQGKAMEESLGRLAAMVSVLFAFFAFSRG